jgi:hypothetical protein
MVERSRANADENVGWGSQRRLREIVPKPQMFEAAVRGQRESSQRSDLS